MTVRREPKNSYGDVTTSMYLWEPGTEPEFDMRFPGHRVFAVGFADSGKSMITALSDNNVWYTSREGEITLARYPSVWGTCVGSAGQKWLLGIQDPGADPRLGGWAAICQGDPPILSNGPKFPGTPEMIAWLEESTRYVVLDGWGTLYTVEVAAGKPEILVKPPRDKPIYRFDAAEDGRAVGFTGVGWFGISPATRTEYVPVHSDPSRTYRACRLRALRAVRALQGPYELWTISTNRDSDQGGLLEIWNVDFDRIAKVSSYHLGSISRCGLSRDCKHLLLADEKTVRVIDCRKLLR
jgi:hypothetical protein